MTGYRRQPCLVPVALSAILLVASGSLFGQLSEGSIAGTVVDPSNQVISSVRLTLSNEETGQQMSAESNGYGYYLFTPVKPGTYTISAEATGFKSFRTVHFNLQVSQKATCDIRLAIGTVQESIEVTAAAPVLSKETAAIGQVINNKQVTDLPLNGRNFLNLALLVPGASDNPGTESNFSINGQRGNMASILYDGMEARAILNGKAAFTPSIDAVQEFRIQQNSYSAEYGAGTAVIMTAFRAGTNELHGSVFEFLRNNALDARNLFDTGSSLPAYRRNQFGVAAGGPIVKNRTFFFGNYEGSRIRQSRTKFANVPETAQLNGDFTGAAQIFDPLTLDSNNQRQAFPGNQIPATRISRYAKAALTLFPKPNLTGVKGQNYVAIRNDSSNGDQYHFRVDHQLGEKDSVFVRFSKSNADSQSLSALPLTGTITSNDAIATVLTETHVFGPNVINQFRLGYTYLNGLSGFPLADHAIATVDYGWKNMTISGADQGMPLTNITGITGMGSTMFAPQGSREHQYQLGDDVTFHFGKHSIKAGLQISHFRPSLKDLSSPNGTVSFENRYTRQNSNSSTTGSAVADFVLGDPVSARTTLRMDTNGSVNLRYSNYGFFVQDDWKVTRTFTVNLGLRYEYQDPIREIYNAASSWSLTENRFLYVGKDLPSLTKPDKNNFSPRVGLAFSPTSRTVIRAGVGVFYGFTRGFEYPNYHLNPPYTNDITLNSDSLRPTLTDGVLFPAPSRDLTPGLGVYSISYDFPANYTYQWNFGIQREIVPNLSLEVAYVGSGSHKLTSRTLPNQAYADADLSKPTAIAARRPNPNIGDILYTAAIDNANYNALQTKLEKRFSQGLSLLASYTFSKPLGITENNDYSSVTDPRNRRRDYGPLLYYQKYRFTSAVTYELPFGKGKHFFNQAGRTLNWVVAGWQVDAMPTFYTAISAATTPTSNVSSNRGRSDRNRPDRVSDGNLASDQRTLNRYFDTSAFVAQPFGAFGNSGAGILTMPGANNWDMSLIKNTSFRERYTFQLRGEFFSAFNHPQWGQPGLSLGTAQFGVISSASGSRSIQLGAKVLW